MTSAIDNTKPVAGNPTTASVRTNFTIARDEISALQAARVIRISSINDSIEVFQQCVTNNTPQVIDFTEVTYNSPSGSFTFDDSNNEIVFNEIGWYQISLSFHAVRKTAGGGDSIFAIHSQTKAPAGSFANFPGSARYLSFPGSLANERKFFSFSYIAPVTEVGLRLRWLQTCSDVTKQVGIVSYPAVSPLPSASAITFSAHKIGVGYP